MSPRVGLSAKWLVDGQVVSDHIITKNGLEAIAKILAGKWTVNGWYIKLGSDATPEDVLDSQLYSEVLSKQASVEVESDPYFSRATFTATFTASELSGQTIGELGLIVSVTLEDGSTIQDVLIDRTMYGPASFDTDKTFTCILEFRRW